MSTYFDQAGEVSSAPGRFVRVDELPPLMMLPGLEFRPVSTDAVMTNFVRFEPNTPAPMHHHSEQQIAIILSGEVTFTVGDETRVMRGGECVVIPPHVPHGAVSGPDGCEALDVFTPPRAGILEALSAAQS